MKIAIVVYFDKACNFIANHVRYFKSYSHSIQHILNYYQVFV